MFPNIYTKIFLITLLLKSLIESYLEKRNQDYIIKNRHAVPEKFSGKITLEDHQKAADYALAKIQIGKFFHTINLIILLAFTVFGGTEMLTRISLSFPYDNRITGLIFFGLFAGISSLIGLPEDLYTTFVLEEKFGFNKTTIKTFIIDRLKGIFIGLLIGTPILYAILTIMEKLSNNWWIYAFFFLTAIQLLLLYLYPTVIAPLFNKFSELDNQELKLTITNLLERTGLKSDGIFVMDASKRSSHGNAYFTGLGKNKRIVFFDTLLNGLSNNEVEAVLAHEIGHMKKKHILKMMIKSFIFSFIGFWLLNYLKNNSAFFAGHGVSTMTNANILLIFSMITSVYTFFLTPISSWMSRKNEYEADQFAAENSSAKELITALVKMYNDNKSFILPDPMYSKFYYSHPPAIERINFLEKFES